jgi:hypothetical protein
MQIIACPGFSGVQSIYGNTMAHNEKLKVESNMNKATTFTIVIPKHE